MACEGFPANSFRASVLNGGQRTTPLVATKQARRHDPEAGLGTVDVQRAEGRRSNHRNADRTPLGRVAAKVRKGRRLHEVALVNLSGGGAMIEAELNARLWDKLTLVLGDHGEIECAVRWIRGDRFGLEFAHETRIDCDAITRNATLREVIRTNFAEQCDGEEVAEQAAELTAETPNEIRGAARHPLIWSGMIHAGHDMVVVRLRNISATGAMVQSVATLAPDSDVVLDLGNAGALAARVCWSHGDQAGLTFTEEFDVRRLAACKPEIAERKWAKPEYLRDDSVESSPWASQWGRLTLRDLSRNLAR